MRRARECVGRGERGGGRDRRRAAAEGAVAAALSLSLSALPLGCTKSKPSAAGGDLRDASAKVSEVQADATLRAAPAVDPGDADRGRDAPDNRPPLDAAAPPDAKVAVLADGGASSVCKRIYGPVRQPFTGPARLEIVGRSLRVVTHRNGTPAFADVPLEPPGAPVKPPVSTDDVAPPVSSPPCAVAGNYTFCVDEEGAVHRYRADGSDPRIVARARPGSPLSAALLGGAGAPERPVVAYIADRKTTEGITSEAYVFAEGDTPRRISEDGSGATFVAIAQQGERVAALMLDARVAMTPVHVRWLAIVEQQVKVGPDAVVFIGGSAERRTLAALATSASPPVVFGVLPIAREVDFGMVVIPVDDPPREDVAGVWSMYPNGLDPAPIAATAFTSPIRVARVRPIEVAARSDRGLELGQLDAQGNFASLGFVTTGRSIRHLSIASDRFGALWISYTDDRGSWLERRVCP
jgi:hypothetical protein